jgi:dihydrodipicolinate synthase/N-acetylneuraminate lyase
VAQAVAARDAGSSARVGEVRALVQRLPFQAALKTIVGLRGVPVGADVRAPLRGLSTDEERDVRRLLERIDLGVAAGA